LDKLIEDINNLKSFIAQRSDKLQRLFDIFKNLTWHAENYRELDEIFSYLNSCLFNLEANKKKLEERFPIDFKSVENSQLEEFEHNLCKIKCELKEVGYENPQTDKEIKLNNQIAELFKTQIINKLKSIAESTNSCIASIKKLHDECHVSPAVVNYPILQQQLNNFEKLLVQLNSFQEKLQLLNAKFDCVEDEETSKKQLLELSELDKDTTAADILFDNMELMYRETLGLLGSECELEFLQCEFEIMFTTSKYLQEQAKRYLDKMKLLYENNCLQKMRDELEASECCDRNEIQQILDSALAIHEDIMSCREFTEQCDEKLNGIQSDCINANSEIKSFRDELSQHELTEAEKISEAKNELTNLIMSLKAKLDCLNEVMRDTYTGKLAIGRFVLDERLYCGFEKLEFFENQIRKLNYLCCENKTTEIEYIKSIKEKSTKKRIMLAVIIPSPILVCGTSVTFFKIQKLLFLALRVVIPLSITCFSLITITTVFFLYWSHIFKETREKFSTINDNIYTGKKELIQVNFDTPLENQSVITQETQIDL
jgi:hypothetical protein